MGPQQLWKTNYSFPVGQKIGDGLLKYVLNRTSARTHNNTKADLSSLFQFFEGHNYLTHNFVKGIRSLQTKPNLHKTYTPLQLDQLEGYLKKNDPMLLLFVKFVSYAFLRPIRSVDYG